MAFDGLTSSPLRRPEASNSTNVQPGSFSWGLVQQYAAADTGQLKAACLHQDTLYVSSRRGIWQIDSSSGR
jgi:hypothetical protein